MCVRHEQTRGNLFTSSGTDEEWKCFHLAVLQALTIVAYAIAIAGMGKVRRGMVGWVDVVLVMMSLVR